MRKRLSNGITQIEISSRENKEDIRSGGQNRRSRRFNLEKPPCRAANIPSDHWQNSEALGFVNEDQAADGSRPGNQVGPTKQGDRRGSNSSNRAGSTYKKLSQPRKSSTYKSSLVRAMCLGELKLSVIHLGRRIFRYSLADRGLCMIAFQIGHVPLRPDQRFIPIRQILRRKFNEQIAALADYGGVSAP
jgi:hypothetical protein